MSCCSVTLLTMWQGNPFDESQIEEEIIPPSENKMVSIEEDLLENKNIRKRDIFPTFGCDALIKKN